LRDYRFDVQFTGNTATINFDGLYKNNIYLVKTNISNSIIPAANTGGLNSHLLKTNNICIKEYSSPQTELNPILNEIQQFNANPPLLDKNALFLLPHVRYAVGDSRLFWMNVPRVQKRATLRALGQYCNIWITDEEFGVADDKVHTADAEEMATVFDLIYPIETNLCGYEYGGGPNGDGGRDGDTKIQILIQNIDGADGYFSAADWFPQSQIPISNEAEMFYIHTRILTSSRTLPGINRFSAILSHEFEHLIHFNQKYAKYGQSYSYINAVIWENEMFSQMTQVVIPSSISSTNLFTQTLAVVYARMYDIYNGVGLSELGSNHDNYGKTFLFGNYLLRNFGGPRLLHDILHNDKVGVPSITDALHLHSPGMTFERALLGYGEALLFSHPGPKPKGALTFDRAASSTVNGVEYRVEPLSTDRELYYFPLDPIEMRPHSICIHQAPEWKGATGRLTITFTRPTDPNIVQYLILK
jgi:hypothetical protein